MNADPIVPAQTSAVALERLDRAWFEAGVVRHQREAMLADVAIDLEAAASDGVGPGELLQPSIEEFAIELADARALDLVKPHYARVFLGAAVGAVAGLALGYPAATAIISTSLQSQDTWVAGVAVYAGLAVMCVAAALVGIATVLRREHAVAGTLARAAITLPVAGAVLAPVTVAFAQAAGYSDAMSVVLLEGGFVLGGCAATIAACRRAAVRRALR